MPKFKKKPVIIEAIQWVGNYKEILEFTNYQAYKKLDDNLYVDTMEGEMQANINDWIIKGAQGEFYPCKPDIFEKTHEAI